MQTSVFFDIILLMGSALSIFTAFFLSTSNPDSFNTKVLVAISILWSYIVFISALGSHEFFMNFPHLFYTRKIAALLIFPSLYIYIRDYLYKGSITKKETLLHSLPALIYIVLISTFIFQDESVKSEIIKSERIPAHILLTNIIFSGILIIQGLIYASLSLGKVQYKFELFKDDASKRNYTSRLWLYFLILIYLLIWGTVFIKLVFEITDNIIPIALYRLYYFLLVIVTFGISFFIIKYPKELLKINAQNLKSNSVRLETKTNIENIKEEEKSFEEEFNSELNNNYKAEKELIKKYLEVDKAYLIVDLTLQNMSDVTTIPKHRLSLILKEEFGKSFYELVNEYRVNEAISLIKDGKHNDFTLQYISEKSGFNSKVTFNRVFKKITNHTPTEYISMYSV